jgi:hypothetical protein
MSFRVFSQEPSLMGALPKLLSHARRFFAAEIDVLSGSPPGSAHGAVRLRFEARRYEGAGTFVVTSRPNSDDDRFAAEAAEARGNAGGMALLAARCSAVWEVKAEQATGSAELQLAAALASVALGPVLPEDGSTLYGVRGAMERAEKAGR